MEGDVKWNDEVAVGDWVLAFQCYKEQEQGSSVFLLFLPLILGIVPYDNQEYGPKKMLAEFSFLKHIS